jgi:type IV pilus assembly protein PilW
MGMIKTDNPLFLHSGFSLIELLVAMAIASIMMALIGGAYWGQTRISRDQQMVVAMQQNLRSAMYLLERDMKMAGFDSDKNSGPSATIKKADPDEFEFEYVDDSNTLVTVNYDLFDSKSDGDLDISRRVKVGNDAWSDHAAIAENIEEVEFFYTLTNGRQTTDLATLTPPGDEGDIRVVGVSVLARTESETRSGEESDVSSPF